MVSPANVAVPKRRRASKAESDIVRAEDVGRMIAGGMRMIAMVRGDHWKVTDEAATEHLGAPISRLLNRHPGWAKAIANVSDPTAILMGVVTLLAVPVMTEIAYKQQQNELQNPATSSTPASPAEPGPATSYQGRGDVAGRLNIVSDGSHDENGVIGPTFRQA